MNESRKLYEELKELEKFFEENNIRYLKSETEKGVIYDFKILLVSYVLINDRIERSNVFDFSLSISYIKKISILYELNTREHSNIPFHPHFKIKKESLLGGKEFAVWMNYEDYDVNESVLAFIKKVLLSLQYNFDYIKVNCKNLGNEKAKFWFLEEYFLDKKKFPTDSLFKKDFKIEDLTSQKKFEIIPEDPSTRNISANIKNIEPFKKKFKIENVSLGNSIKEKEMPEFNIDNSLSSIKTNNKGFKLFINATSKQLLWDHIKWGNQHTLENKVEQGGLLLGKVYFDSKKNIQFGVVENIISGRSAKGNAAYLEMDHTTWKDMIDQIDVILDEDPENNLHIIGWYHTHPNQLSVFMSGTDMNTQHKLFNQKWHYAIVLNPHKQVWKAFFGKNAIECDGMFIQGSSEQSPNNAENRNEILDKNEKPLEEKKKNISTEKKNKIRIRNFIIVFETLIIVLLLGFNLINGLKNQKNSDILNNQNQIIANQYSTSSEGKSTSIQNNVSSTGKNENIRKQAIDSITLKIGQIIYSQSLKNQFNDSLGNILKVKVVEETDSTISFEIPLYANKVIVTPLSDTTIIVKGKSNLRTQKLISTKSKFGNLGSDCIFPLIENDSDWYTFKFSGLIFK